MHYVIILVTVSIAAFIGPLVGVGGAVINIPILRLLGYDLINFVIPLTIFLALISALSSSIYYLNHRFVRVRDSLYLGLPMLFSSYLGAKTTPVIGARPVEILLGVYLLMSGVKLVWFKDFQINVVGRVSNLGLVGVGLISGFLLGLMGIIGGSLISSIFILSGVDIKSSMASGLFAALFAGVGGTLGHTTHIDFPLKWLLLCGLLAFGMARLGAYVMKKWRNTALLEKIIGYFFIFLAIQMILV